MTLANRSAFAAGFCRGVLPEAIISAWEWGDLYFVLSSKWSSDPGPYKSSRTPYVREVLEALSVTHPCQDVTLQWGSQLGKTTIGLVWHDYVIDVAPGPFMTVLPSDKLAKRFSKLKLTPSIEETPRVANRVAANISRNSSNTVDLKDFAGGFSAITGANVAAALAELSVRYTNGDEIDRWPADVNGEGDPASLLDARTRNYGDRKKRLWTSTPTIAGRSRIEDKFLSGDRSRFYVHCPHCGDPQILELGDKGGPGLQWEKGKPATAVYVCARSGCIIEELLKNEMLSGGIWNAEFPERSARHRSFHLSSLYSPIGWFSWSEIAEQFETAQGKPDKLRAFVNTVEAKTWASKGEAPDFERLYARREDYEPRTVPEGGIVLTAGVDVQGDRLEAEVVAWGRDLQSWSVDYLVLPGNPKEAKVWKDLDSLLRRTYPGGPSGDFPLKIAMLAIDSGYLPTPVYQWARKYPSSRVMATKGRDNFQGHVGSPRIVDVNLPGRRIKRGARWWPIGTNFGKTELYEWLYLEAPEEGEDFPPGFAHFPAWDLPFFKGLTAEHLRPKAVRGRGYGSSVRMVWDKHYERNEPLDCRLLARAASVVHGIDRWTPEDWDAVLDTMREEAPAPTRPRRRRQGGYLDRWHPNR